MIDSGIITRLSLRYKKEAVEDAVRKLEKKILDGSFKNSGNKYGVESYLESICKNYGKDPKEKSLDYKNYRFENIFEELNREKGPGWFAKAISEINEINPGHIKKIKECAITSFHYYKVKSSETYGLTGRDERLLTTLYVTEKKPETNEEKALSEKVMARAKEIENKALSEAMAVIWEEGYKNLVMQENEGY
jgi:hypothetical protein